MPAMSHEPRWRWSHGTTTNVVAAKTTARATWPLGNPALNHQAECIANRAAHQIQQTGPICGTPRELDVPGLMTGLAGIGYGLLRAAQPGRIPSVLLLQPPSLHYVGDLRDGY